MKRHEQDLGVLVSEVLGDKLRQTRQSRGLHQAEVAKRANVSVRSVENAESGNRMRLTTISRIAQALGLTLQDVVPGMAVTGAEDNPPAGLAPHLISFEWLLQGVGIRFVGREEVVRALDTFVDNPANRSGYFIVQGKPGTGKTAFLAQLVRQREYVHHFNVALQGINTLAQFLGNVITRLILRYGLAYDELPPEAFSSGRYLNQVLAEASRHPRSFSEPVILLIDALDEVDPRSTPKGANILFLPHNLPPRVYIVATTLQIENIPLRVANARVIDLGSLSSLGDDLRRYVQERVKDKRLREWLARHGHTQDEFIEAMIERSEGNFMYVHRLLGEICQGYYTDGNLDALPYGLMAHYRGNWEAMCHQDEGTFDTAHEPVLAALATATSAITASEIAERSGVEPRTVRRVLTRWRPFLDESLEAGSTQRHYRLYHSTFRKFVRDQLAME